MVGHRGENVDNRQYKIASVGLGYVGLPLAVEFGKKLPVPVPGFDINQARIQELKKGEDSTLEVSAEDIKCAKFLEYSHNNEELKACNVYIVTVPTPNR